jgi:hypothetical protein
MSASRRHSPEQRARQCLTRDVRCFSTYALHRPLRPYQLEAARAIAASVLEERGLTFTVVFPRQAGKNQLSAHLEAFLLHHYRRQGGSIVKAAPTFRPQVVNSILRLEQLLGEPLTDCKWRRLLGYIFRLGRASCSFYSAQPTANVVGATASLLLEGDEAQDLDQQKWDKDLSPMAASRAATRVLYGTPWTDDTLLARQVQLNRELEAKDGLRRHFEVGWETVAIAAPAYRRHVEAEIARLGAHHPIVQTQYLLQPLGRAGRFLDAAQLALLRGTHPPQAGPGPGGWGPGAYVAGLDVAGADEEDPAGLLLAPSPRRDSTVLTIAFAEDAVVGVGGWGLGAGTGPPTPNSCPQTPANAVVEPRLYVVRQYAWRGTPHRQLYPLVLSLVRDHWRCRTVVVDATGVGSGLAAFLGAALGPRVVRPYTYTAASKSKLAYDFLAAVNGGRFKLHAPIPESVGAAQQPLAPSLAPPVAPFQEFFDQAAAAEYALRANQVMSFFVPPSRGHDDLLNAAVLAVQAGPLSQVRVASGRRASVIA